MIEYTNEMRAADAVIAKAMNGEWDRSRCGVCGWPLKERAEDGCVVRYGDSGARLDDCSMRPLPERRADEPPRFHADRDALHGALVWAAAQDRRIWYEFDRRLFGALLPDGGTMESDFTQATLLAPPRLIAAALAKAIEESK